MITTERRIIGNLVGSYAELVELMELANRGKVNLATRQYRLNEANQALHDLNEAKVKGRAVLVPQYANQPELSPCLLQKPEKISSLSMPTLICGTAAQLTRRTFTGNSLSTAFTIITI